MTDPRNFLLNTDYPLDQIVFLTTGSLTIPASTFAYDVDVPHGLPFSPLPYIVWSTSSDFSITYVVRDSAGTVNVSAIADTTNVTVTSSNATGADVTVYYRIFAFAPSGASDTSLVGITSSIGSDFVLNTDYNYMKLVHAGTISTSNTTYTHDLGYIPTVLTWLNTTHDMNVLGQWVVIDPAGNAGIKVTTTTIEFVGSSVNDTEVEYRIYAED